MLRSSKNFVNKGLFQEVHERLLTQLGDLFPSVQALVDRVMRYLLLVGGSRYPVKLVKVRTSWPRRQGYQTKKGEKN